MVAPRTIAIATLLLLATTAIGQSYDAADTTTEYPLKGTFYHNKFEGRKTASGELFDQNLFTAAHWKIKLGTYVLVTNRNSGLQVIVKVNDRCPRRGVFDMSHRAANAIGIKGCQPVTVRLLPDGYEEACIAQDARFDSVDSRLGHSRPTGSTAAEKKSPAGNRKSSKGNKDKAQPTDNGTTQYNLHLGTARSHGEAFEMVERLPEPYKSKTLVETEADSTISVILDVRLSKQKAQELTRALRHTFKHCEITPAE